MLLTIINYSLYYLRILSILHLILLFLWFSLEFLSSMHHCVSITTPLVNNVCFRPNLNQFGLYLNKHLFLISPITIAAFMWKTCVPYHIYIYDTSQYLRSDPCRVWRQHISNYICCLSFTWWPHGNAMLL